MTQHNYVAFVEDYTHPILRHQLPKLHWYKSRGLDVLLLCVPVYYYSNSVRYMYVSS